MRRAAAGRPYKEVTFGAAANKEIIVLPKSGHRSVIAASRFHSISGLGFLLGFLLGSRLGF
jgi:rhodanese-related sulfurtransferase